MTEQSTLIPPKLAPKPSRSPQPSLSIRPSLPASPSFSTSPSGVESMPLTSSASMPASAILQGNEIIELYIKPSRWFIALESAPTAGPSLVLAGLVYWADHAIWSESALVVVMLLLVLTAVASVGLAALQWASRVYVLTNRRVMRFRGIVNVQFDECPLLSIARLELRTPWYQRWVWVGTIGITARNESGEVMAWRMVTRPQEVYRKLRRAIEESQR